MRNVVFLLGCLVLAAWLAPAPADAHMGFSSGYPAGAPYALAPVYPPPFVWSPPVYFAPPAFYFGSGYDPDYRDIRYNRYFQRYRRQPQIRGYTFPR